MAEIVNISYIGSGNESQNYNQKDNSLITNSFIYTKFGDPNDTIEFFINDLNGTLIDKVYNANEYIPSPSINPSTELYSSITLDPQKDLASRGFTRGSLNIQYNFLRNLFNSSYGKFYWIKEISTSRTEIKLASQNISNTEILSGFNQYQAYILNLNYFNDFYLNFGNNQHIIAINVAYTEDADGAYLLIKLYEPLPSNFDVKDQLWIVEKIAESSTYNVDIQVEAATIVEQNVLRGPNFNVNLSEQVGQSTPYYSYSGLITSPISSSYQKMMSYYQDKAININVDYSDFSNFIHFSSATSRIENFVTKVANIENYNYQIGQQLLISGGISNPTISSSVLTLQNSIDSITKNFDIYEYYLYYASSSYAWPKLTSTQPYSLYSVTSSQAINWLGSTSIVPTATTHSILFSASYYDQTNKDLLANTIPQYLLDDANNEPYITFVNMIGQSFDNIWLYYKDVTNRFDATNNPNTGISLDLVADALMGLGLNLYTNTNISDNLYYSMFGINADGSLLPPTGSEVISTYVTSSIATIGANQLQKEIYKRLYHNLPYLYKTKGTRECVNAITNIFGIPKNILTINEFGGNSISNTGVGLEIINDDYKISNYTGISELTGSLLNPNVTLQVFNKDTRHNYKDLEFGFTPSFEINSYIASSSYFTSSIDQYIGDPNAQYSASYPALDQLEREVFGGVNYEHSAYEYIRLLKYYNNSIFKMIKDFVPARSNISTGFIAKSHYLERNKYARHEPIAEQENNFSESIDIISISATDAPEIQSSTQFYETIETVSGSVVINHEFAWEKYTGEFGGTTIEATTGYFDQNEMSSIPTPWTSSVSGATQMYSTYNQGALFQNFTHAVPSKIVTEAEYNNQNTPVNFSNLLSQSKCENCKREMCYSYIVANNKNENIAITYQDCNNLFVSTAIPASGSITMCAKPDTLSADTTLNFEYLSSSVYNICGATYTTDYYTQDCRNVTITNLTTNIKGLSYYDCTGSLHNVTLPGPSTTIFCMDPSRLVVPSGLSSSVGSYCSPPLGANAVTCSYLLKVSVQASTAGVVNYVLCDGTPGSSIVDNDDPISGHTIGIRQCIRQNTLILPPGVSNPVYDNGSLGYCGYYYDVVRYTGSRDLAEIQDYNYYRQSSVNSKYNGAKSVSSKYNIYTTGDDSYGSNPAADYYVDYIGLFTEVESSLYFPDRMTAKMAYMADLSGGLQELNLQNNNWVYFQNIYKNNDIATIKQFDATKYSNQRYLDRNIDIIESGYSYRPYYYRATADGHECFDTNLSENLGASGSSYTKIAWNAYYSRMYNSISTPGPTSSILQSYPIVPFSGSDSCPPASNWWEINLWIGGSTNSIIYGNPDNLTAYTSGTVPTFTGGFGNGRFKTGSYYTVPYDGYYKITSDFVFKKNDTLGDLSGSFVFEIIDGGTGSISSIFSSGFAQGTLIGSANTYVSAAPDANATPYELAFETSAYLTANSKIFYRLKTNYSSQNITYPNQGIYLEPWSNIVFQGVNADSTLCRDTTLITNAIFESGSVTTCSFDLTLNTDRFFNSDSTYTPAYTDYYLPYTSSLYAQYGDVTYTMQPEVGDTIYMYYSSSIAATGSVGSLKPLQFYVYKIDSGSIGTHRFWVSPNLPGYLNSSNINQYNKVVFTKRVPDETNIIFQGTKRPGQTSFGFVIPNNINPDIQKNINSLQATIQSQLLSAQGSLGM